MESTMEKVILEKERDRVKIAGPYTKRSLRKLLLSSISLPILHEDEIDRTLRETGLSEVDLEKLKDGRAEDISEEAKETLARLEITEEMISEILAKSLDDEKDKEERRTMIEEGILDPREEMRRLLRERGLSESLCKMLLARGLDDESIRLLKALGLTDEEIEELQRLWELEIKIQGEHEDSMASSVSSSDEYLSPDGLYLKNYLRKPLNDALREMVAKKPADPVEYLAHWLLHYKVCEEREKKRKEFELELMIEREKYKIRVEEEMPVFEKPEEEEEYQDDWNYVNYEGP